MTQGGEDRCYWNMTSSVLMREQAAFKATTDEIKLPSTILNSKPQQGRNISRSNATTQAMCV
jgi:hypothetical protein